MWFIVVAAALLVGALAYEYRLRRPDQLILYESNGRIGFRTSRWYPRHFSLALPGTTHVLETKVDGTAKGSLPLTVKLVATVAASKEQIETLVRVGGWDRTAVIKAAKEFETMLQAQVKEYTEKSGIEELSSEKIHAHLLERSPAVAQRVGLDTMTLTVQSVDPVDASIAEAMRQRESARILEQTEQLNQRARVAAAAAKFRADEQITLLEHELELKRYELRNVEQEKESILAQKRMEDELARSRMKLEFDKEEMSLLNANPQLLLLTPQVARLAEASQSLKNARTIVTLSPTDVEQGSSLLGMLQTLLHSLVSGSTRKEEKKPKSK